MKATIDIPPDLLHQLKLRAVMEHRKLKDVTADVLRAGLAVPSDTAPLARAVIVTDELTGLPVIRGGRAPSPAEVSPERIARVLHDQEVEGYLHSIGAKPPEPGDVPD